MIAPWTGLQVSGAPLRVGPQGIWVCGIFWDGLRRGHEADIYGIERGHRVGEASIDSREEVLWGGRSGGDGR